LGTKATLCHPFPLTDITYPTHSTLALPSLSSYSCAWISLHCYLLGSRPCLPLSCLVWVYGYLCMSCQLRPIPGPLSGGCHDSRVMTLGFSLAIRLSLSSLLPWCWVGWGWGLIWFPIPCSGQVRKTLALPTTRLAPW